ncbi:hypothetical protein [Klebsiella quasipneumoniae]|uniref:hypothetical protein n=1 Tax=Klebsiella quasipneumoniae TaxID=1463165 RepID=UPI00115A63C1|nr:hypothetical protein [Klebsiella quasipneumoniae]
MTVDDGWSNKDDNLTKRIGVVIGGFGVLMLTNDVTENFPQTSYGVVHKTPPARLWRSRSSLGSSGERMSATQGPHQVCRRG